jgi:hypothetical protein
MKTYYVTEIEWETDGEEVELPTDLYIELDSESMTDSEIEEVLSDEITERTGWLHNGFSWEEYNDDDNDDDDNDDDDNDDDDNDDDDNDDDDNDDDDYDDNDDDDDDES